MSVNSILKAIAQRVLEFTQQVYGDRLLSLVVYGSLGRGRVNYFSDIDLLIVARTLPKGRLRRVGEFEEIESRVAGFIKEAERYGVFTRLSPIFKTKEEVLRGSPLFLDMIDDAIILYDREDFFSSYLDRLRDRLGKLGARRVRQGTRWYWILKPDYKPGEIFEI